jgi:hypothetical protein
MHRGTWVSIGFNKHANLWLLEDSLGVAGGPTVYRPELRG